MHSKRFMATMPPRFRAPSPFVWGLAIIFIALFVQGVMATEITLERLLKGAVNLTHFIGRAFPLILKTSTPLPGPCLKRSILQSWGWSLVSF